MTAAPNRHPTAGRTGTRLYDAIPEPEPREQAAARRRVARTEAVLQQALAAATPEQARKLIVSSFPIAAKSYILSDDPDCRLRLLAATGPPGREPKLTLQRQETRDSRWHDMTLAPEEAAQLRRFLELADPSPDTIPNKPSAEGTEK